MRHTTLKLSQFSKVILGIPEAGKRVDKERANEGNVGLQHKSGRTARSTEIADAKNPFRGF